MFYTRFWQYDLCDQHRRICYFNVLFGINELIANALAWVFAVLFSYVTNKKWVFKVATPTKTAFLVQMFAFSVADLSHWLLKRLLSLFLSRFWTIQACG